MFKKILYAFLLLPTLIFAQNIQTVGEPADTLKQAHIRVDTTLHVFGTARFDGTLQIVTTVGEQFLLGPGSDALPELSSMGDPNTGIRFPGSDITTFVQGGAEKARIDPNGINIGATTTPKAKLQVTAIGISSADYYKGLRLSNPDAATEGVRAFSPALVFRGAGWKTDATARSDSVLMAQYLIPVQGSTAPTGRFYWDFKIGEASWANRMFLTSAGLLMVDVLQAATRIQANTFQTYSVGDMTIQSSLGNYQNIIIKNTGTTPTETARFTTTGNLGLGTTTPQAKLSVVGADGTGTGIHVVSSDVNINRTTWAQATDTSSVENRIDSAGNGLTKWVAADGDSARIHVRTDSTVFYSKNALAINAPAVNINHKAVVADSFRVEKTTILKGNTAIGSGTAWFTAEDSLIVTSGVTRSIFKRSMPDDGTYVPTTGVCGKGFLRSDAEHITFTFVADGTVTLGTDCSINVDDADTDDKLCVYDNGSGIIIKNRLGSTKNILIDLEYMTP